MILEALLALSLSQAPSFYAPPVLAKSFSSSRSSSFSSGRSFSYSSPSRSSFSSPSRSISTPSRSVSAPSRPPSFSFSGPSTPASKSSVRPATVASPSASKPSVQRISKQVAPPSAQPRPIPSTPIASPSIGASRATTREPRVITRETYVNNYHDGGIAGNPFFWLWALDNNRGGGSGAPQQQQVPQVAVVDTNGEKVTVPASQLVVQRNAWSPVREFFVFTLGGGIGVLLGRRFSP